MEKEWAKIRRLEQKLGAANRAQEEMANRMHDHKMKIESDLLRAKYAKEEKKSTTQAYDLKHKRGLTS